VYMFLWIFLLPSTHLSSFIFCLSLSPVHVFSQIFTQEIRLNLTILIIDL
jgi:hypothetical protein